MVSADVFAGAVLTVPGFEDVAAAEVSELVGSAATTARGGIVTFVARSWVDLCRVCYLSQSANRVFLLTGVSSSGDDMTSVDVIKNGVCLTPFDSGERNYEIFGRQESLPGNLAYLMLRASGYTGRGFFFDPFTRSGGSAIEAALFSSGFPVNRYRRDALSSSLSRMQQFASIDFGRFFAVAEKEAAAAAERRLGRVKSQIFTSSRSMVKVLSAEKNAKLAGVKKQIRFGRLDISWLDAKLDENSVDLVVSYPPQFRNGVDSFSVAENRKLKAMYTEFFHQADFFLRRNGMIVLALETSAWVAAEAEKSGFCLSVLKEISLEAAHRPSATRLIPQDLHLELACFRKNGANL